jgi:hypothetical protein
VTSQDLGQSDSRCQSANSVLKHFLDEPPKLHGPKGKWLTDDPSAEDGLENWGIQRTFLELMVEMVASDSLTLETGCGLSTVCLAIIGTDHICVSPSQEEHNRIRAYCSKHQISTERIRFIQMYSHAALPLLDTGGRRLDFALIDGGHAFPQPMIDYYYVNEHLKVGGLLAIDDLNIPNVGILHKFLITEPAYEFVKFDGLKTGVYRKVGETSYRFWKDQRFNSPCPNFSYLPFHTRVLEQLRPVKQKLRITLGRVPGLRGAYRLLKASCGKGS